MQIGWPRQVGFCRGNETFGQWCEACEFEFAPVKPAVRDSVMQIGNHTSKSEASIQSGTVLNAGESGEFGDGSIGSRTAKGTQRYARLPGYRNKFETKMSVSRIAQMLERSQSLLQYCNVVQIAKLAFYPSLHYKMKAKS